MSIPKPHRALDAAQRRRLISLALVRILATSLGLVALYYFAPLHQLVRETDTETKLAMIGCFATIAAVGLIMMGMLA